jgi:hypothetical protein
MRKQFRREPLRINPLLYSLTDEGVEYRNRLRSWIGAATWLGLSVATMIVMLLAASKWELIPIAVIVGVSLIKYVPLLSVVYNRARVMAALYLDDVYELQNEELASDFLEEVAFSMGHDKITIKEGGLSEKDEQSPLILIGGPGMIQVNLDSIALLEKVNGEPHVIYPRSTPWLMGRFERIREIGRFDEVGKREYAIINLRDQFIHGLRVKSRTKDGIPLEAHDIKVIFSILRRSNEGGDKKDNASLFDERAVQSLVYNQTIITPEPLLQAGITFPWDTTVIPLVVTELEDLIRSHNLGEILASISQKEVEDAFINDQTEAQMRVELTGQQVKVGRRSDAPRFNPRSNITEQFFSREFKEKAASLGIAIEWIDIGAWKPRDFTLDRHRAAWEVSRTNAVKRKRLKSIRKKHAHEEMLRLIKEVVVENYDKKAEFHKLSNEEINKLSPEATREYQRQLKQHQQGSQRRSAKVIAQAMLESFRVELGAAKSSLEKDNTLPPEKTADLHNINKALENILHLLSAQDKRP